MWGGRESRFSYDMLSGSSLETLSIVRNPPKLEISFRKQCELIIVIPHSAKKSKFSLRTAQKYKKRTEEWGRGMLHMCVSRKKKVSNSSPFETM